MARSDFYAGRAIRGRAVASGQDADSIQIKLACAKCRTELRVQANFKPGVALKAGVLPYPRATDLLKCPQCGTENSLAAVRLQLEAQTGKKVL